MLKVHDPPIIYNIAHDPSERFPLSSESEPDLNHILGVFLEMKKEIEDNLEWLPSRNMQFSESAIPCCNPGCDPFPLCCTCEEKDYR